MVRLADGRANAQVAGGENVGTPQREDQEHVRGPDADAFHLRQMLDDFVVRQVRARSRNFIWPLFVLRARSRM